MSQEIKSIDKSLEKIMSLSNDIVKFSNSLQGSDIEKMSAIKLAYSTMETYIGARNMAMMISSQLGKFDSE